MKLHLSTCKLFMGMNLPSEGRVPATISKLRLEVPSFTSVARKLKIVFPPTLSNCETSREITSAEPVAGNVELGVAFR